jgi:MFS family permease
MFLRSHAAFPRQFWALFSADFILRSGYQIGKTPLLPLFAAMLGAGEALIGLIAGVSTATGLLLKPLFGILSDRWGRRPWLWISLLIFVVTPFFYQAVETAEQLVALRLFHGFATAIFGPVTLAYIFALQQPQGPATRLAWFGMARQGSYLIAPSIAGWLLTFWPPEKVFSLIGLMSAGAVLPFLLLTEPLPTGHRHGPLLAQLQTALRYSIQQAGIWWAGIIELGIYMVTSALKAFLPIHLVYQIGHSFWIAGAFFTLQELAHFISRPLGGWIADRLGLAITIACGLAFLAAALALLRFADTFWMLPMIAIISGCGQGLILPATTALVGRTATADNIGAVMGVYGALRNLGKITGPIIIGGVLESGALGFLTLFQFLAVFLLIVAVVFAARRR